MKVALLSCTQDALNLLLRTKNTRLKFTSDPSTWTDEQRQQHIDYMRDTIQSSWEFVEYVFQIEGVSRAFTHQLVRTRTGSYAQESQRTIDARENPVISPLSAIDWDEENMEAWVDAERTALAAYSKMIDGGISPQDARGILPTNISTSIVAKFSLRTLSDMAKVRLCTRTQGEYQNVFREMRRLVIETHPWAKEFINVHCVSVGTCAFPRYGKAECPLYDPRMDLDALRKETAAKWETIRFEARPKSSGGKAQ